MAEHEQTTTVRPETPGDIPAIDRVNREAFGRPQEGQLVNALRNQASPLVSLVAEAGGEVVGHILFSPVHVRGARRVPALMMGLAPMAVTPKLQRQGIGSQLVCAGLEACRRTGCGAVVVLGHPDYYPRFGFVPASHFGLRCEYPVPDEVFMAQELMPCALDGCQGLIQYHPAFASV